MQSCSDSAESLLMVDMACYEFHNSLVIRRPLSHWATLDWGVQCVALLWKRSAIYHRPRAAKQLAGNILLIFWRQKASNFPSWDTRSLHTVSIGSRHALVLDLCCKLVSYALLQIVHPVENTLSLGDMFGPHHFFASFCWVLPGRGRRVLYRGLSGPDFCGKQCATGRRAFSGH